MAKYWKSFVAAAGAVAIAVQSALTDGTITDAEKVTIVLAVLTLIGVFAKSNAPA